jgi:hypothetical protein
MNKIPFWLWVVGFVILGCTFEYFWMTGFERLNKTLTRRQKMATGVVLLCIAAAALSFGLFRVFTLRSLFVAFGRHTGEEVQFDMTMLPTTALGPTPTARWVYGRF